MQAVTAKTQIARRRQKARRDILEIRNIGKHPLFSTFRVVSRTEREYTVHIRSVDQLINSCSCPDYKTNTVSTCKHIEGVLQFLKKHLGDDWAALASDELPCAEIFLHRSEYPSVRIAPNPEKLDGKYPEVLFVHFNPDGEFTGSATNTLPGVLEEIDALEPEMRNRIFVHEDVRSYIKNLKHEESISRQKKWFTEQVEKGNHTLDVLRSDLYGFQEDGVVHLAFGGRSLLADDMGLGKTVQAIGAVSLLKELRNIKRVLVICPSSLKHQWEREIHRFSGFSTNVIGGPPILRNEHYRKPAFFNIINYELVRRDADEMQIMQPDVIILDEAQRIKNWRTKTADAVKRLRSRYAFVLTGTPLENRLDELYSVFQFIDPHVLGPLWRFNQRYFELEQRKSGTYKVLGYKNMAELRRRIAPHVLRRTRDQVLKDLPPRTDNNYFVEMTSKQKKPYNEYRETMAMLLAMMKKRPLTPKEHDILLRSLVKMRMICDALALHDKSLSQKDAEATSPKLRELKLILEDEVLENGRKALVFSQWTTMLKLAERAIEPLGINSVTLSGSVPSNKRGALIEKFFEDDECGVFFSSDAGGTGLNLQAASLVINLDLPWNPAVLEQRIARAHRHGQKNAVQVVNLIAQGTIEEKMLDTLSAKREVFQGVFGTDESVDSIDFRDTGQQIAKQLQEMLEEEYDSTVKFSQEVTDSQLEAAEEKADYEPGKSEAGESRPFFSEGVYGFVDEILETFSARILQIACYTPEKKREKQLIVVVDSGAEEVKPEAQRILEKHFSDSSLHPPLHVMDRNGYETLTSILGGDIDIICEESRSAETHRPSPDELLRKKLKKVRKGFDQAERKLKLARVLIEGGFPEEVMRPVRDALAWTLSSLTAIRKQTEPKPALPTPRTVQAELVETGMLSTAQAGEISRIRELSEQPEQPEDIEPPPSIDTIREMTASVEALIDLGREATVISSV
jgi:superfamily II DNA or RNA helicase